ncbi:MAG: dipeptide ABC transporter ATP-binding protein [Oscillospiraceae bacterium]|jgi:oligopeptide/dipeptide ABC transporter ATP-binding protein|nr:dipeptide ABC transporter ATP-binding protein [Oscillospiraceae bacterium]
MREELVRVENLVKEFPVRRGIVHAVSDVSLSIYQGETLCLVGESGCGKSTLGRLILRLIEPTSGAVYFRGEEVTAMRSERLRETRRRMQMIFQDPYASLDPRMSVGQIIAEPLKTYKVGESAAARKEMIRALMDTVGIRPEFYGRYPHQFSGGQRQRIGIARALALNPELIVCDEPVSALDVSIQAQILNLLSDLQKEKSLTYLFISHDLSVVRYLANRVCVMFLGKVCELGDTESVYENPKHPYTHFLLSSVPLPDPTRRGEEKEILTGEIPSPVNPPAGCRFHTRCPYARELCAKAEPPLQEAAGRQVACHFPL